MVAGTDAVFCVVGTFTFASSASAGAREAAAWTSSKFANSASMDWFLSDRVTE